MGCKVFYYLSRMQLRYRTILITNRTTFLCTKFTFLTMYIEIFSNIFTNHYKTSFLNKIINCKNKYIIKINRWHAFYIKCISFYTVILALYIFLLNSKMYLLLILQNCMNVIKQLSAENVKECQLSQLQMSLIIIAILEVRCSLFQSIFFHKLVNIISNDFLWCQHLLVRLNVCADTLKQYNIAVCE